MYYFDLWGFLDNADSPQAVKTRQFRQVFPEYKLEYFLTSCVNQVLAWWIMVYAYLCIRVIANFVSLIARS